jgi:hypothetical protein
MAIYGRAGDIVMSMWAASLIRDQDGAAPALLVGAPFAPFANLLRDKLEMPVGIVVAESSSCPLRDEAVMGSFMASWSDELLRRRHPGFDSYINCCLPCPPPEKVHMAAFMAYVAGVCDSLGITPRFPRAPRRSKPKERAAFHFGASDASRRIEIARKPLEMECVCVGGRRDPIPDWIDEDLRGLSLEDTIEEIVNSKVMVGSDSLMTHLSGLAGVPTACFHATLREEASYSRELYACGVSMLAGPGGIVNPMLVREAVCERLQP